jgi:ribosome recycling factor
VGHEKHIRDLANDHLHFVSKKNKKHTENEMDRRASRMKQATDSYIIRCHIHSTASQSKNLPHCCSL